MISIRTIALVLLAMSLAACKSGMEDINSFMAKERAKPPRPIEPLPEIQPQETFEYNAYDLRDPFSNDLAILAEEEALANSQVIPTGEGPDLQRRKEILESYPLDSMLMVGTYQQEESYWGLVVDPEGIVHRTEVGQHIGHNYGEIIAIHEDEIIIEEWVNDGLGTWTKRNASMALNDEQ